MLFSVLKSRTQSKKVCCFNKINFESSHTITRSVLLAYFTCCIFIVCWMLLSATRWHETKIGQNISIAFTRVNHVVRIICTMGKVQKLVIKLSHVYRSLCNRFGVYLKFLWQHLRPISRVSSSLNVALNGLGLVTGSQTSIWSEIENISHRNKKCGIS